MDKFNTKHIMFIIFGVSIVSLKTYPEIYMNSGGRDSWIAVIASSIIILLFSIYTMSICYKNKCYDIKKLYCDSIGNFFGNIFLFFLLMTIFLVMIESLSIEANSMHTNMMLETPVWFLMLFFSVPALYTLKKGKAAIMSISIVGLLFIFLAGINLGILTIKYKHFKYLFPLFENGLTLNFLFSILKSLGLYGSFYIVFIFLDSLDKDTSLKKYVLIAIIIVIQMEIVSSIGVISTFEIKHAKTMWYPKLLQTQLVNYFGFLESGELYVMLQIIGGWYIKYILSFYAFLNLLKKLAPNFNISPVVITVFVFLISFLLANNNFLLFKWLNYFSYMSLINFIIIPFIMFTIYGIKNKN